MSETRRERAATPAKAHATHKPIDSTERPIDPIGQTARVAGRRFHAARAWHAAEARTLLDAKHERYCFDAPSV